jgi:hypothetical protein
MKFAFHRLGQPRAAHAAHGPHPPLDAPGDYATMFDPEKLTLPANVPGT